MARAHEARDAAARQFFSRRSVIRASDFPPHPLRLNGIIRFNGQDDAAAAIKPGEKFFDRTPLPVNFTGPAIPLNPGA